MIAALVHKQGTATLPRRDRERASSGDYKGMQCKGQPWGPALHVWAEPGTGED